MIWRFYSMNLQRADSRVAKLMHRAFQQVLMEMVGWLGMKNPSSPSLSCLVVAAMGQMYGTQYTHRLWKRKLCHTPGNLGFQRHQRLRSHETVTRRPQHQYKLAEPFLHCHCRGEDTHTHSWFSKHVLNISFNVTSQWTINTEQTIWTALTVSHTHSGWKRAVLFFLVSNPLILCLRYLQRYGSGATLKKVNRAFIH